MAQKKVGIWIRVSTINQVETESHLHHEIRAKKFIKTRGWKVKKTYRLEGLSGSSVIDYPETKRMLNDIKTGAISGLVFSEISRLARSTKELIEIAEFFNKHGADLVAINMSVDTSTPMGRHFFRTMGSMAELEREMIVRRINGSIATRAELGKWIGGQPPLGYKYVDKKLVINEEETPLCQAIFEIFLECKRKRTTARLLNEKGYRTRKDNKFTDSTIKRILSDPVYKGLHRMNYSRMTKDGKREIRPKEEWVLHSVEPTISKELWENVNTIIKKQYTPRSQPLNTKIHLFTQFVFCHCGARMFTHSKTKNYLCRSHCGNRIHKEDLEEVFKTELHSYTVSKSNMETYFKQLQNIVSKKEKEHQLLLKEKEKINTKITKLLELHVQDQIETEAFNTYHKEPYERLGQLEKTIAELEGEILSFSHHEESTNYVIDETKNLYENWDSLDKDKKRNIIETITEKIIIGTQDITINLYKLLPDGLMPPSLEKDANGQHNLWSGDYFSLLPFAL